MLSVGRRSVRVAGVTANIALVLLSSTALSLFFSKDALAQETTGDLLGYCEAYQRGAKEREGQLLLRNVPAAICFGYFNAIHHLAYAQTSPDEQQGMLRHICLPNHGPDVFQLIRVFMAYAHEHPQYRDEQAVFGVANALTRAFPCND